MERSQSRSVVNKVPTKKFKNKSIVGHQNNVNNDTITVLDYFNNNDEEILAIKTIAINL